MSGLRRPVRSEIDPAKTRRILAVLSATPSIRPTAVTGAPSTAVRKIGRTGTIISELMSVKKLTSPAATTFRGSAVSLSPVSSRVPASRPDSLPNRWSDAD
jgi:hypothetical protein